MLLSVWGSVSLFAGWNGFFPSYDVSFVFPFRIKSVFTGKGVALKR